jgi:ATP-dependent Lon protease
MSEEEKIPIFPLSVVLMPHSMMPLHIFEERYKQMINECLDGKKLFGVVYIENKHMHKTGCTAFIEKVIKKYEDGRMDILVTGRNRFRITDISEEKPYLESSVVYFEDELLIETPEMTDLARDGIALLKRLEKIMEVNERLDRVKSLDFEVISFLLAGSQGLTLAEKQELLEIENTGERLTRSVELLKNALNRARLMKQIRNIRSDALMTHGFSKN